MTITAWIFVLIVTAIVAFLSGANVEHRLSVKHREEKKGGAIFSEKWGCVNVSDAVQKEVDALRNLNREQSERIKKLESDLDEQWEYSKKLHEWSKVQTDDFNHLRDIAVKMEMENERLRAKLGMDSLAPSAASNEVTVIKESKEGVMSGTLKTKSLNLALDHDMSKIDALCDKFVKDVANEMDNIKFKVTEGEIKNSDIRLNDAPEPITKPNKPKENY